MTEQQNDEIIKLTKSILKVIKNTNPIISMNALNMAIQTVYMVHTGDIKEKG